MPPSPQGGGIRRDASSHPQGRHHRDIKVRDSNGAELAEGDSVTLIKDLKLKGSSTVLKRGTMIRNIHLTDNDDEIEARTDKVKGLVLRTEFLRKAKGTIDPHIVMAGLDPAIHAFLAGHHEGRRGCPAQGRA